MKLTTETARDLSPGNVLRCHVVKGLELHANATGKTWKVYYRAANGAGRRRPKLGNFPALSIERAREAAKALLARVAKGEDVSGDRQALRAAPTIKDLFDVYRKERIEKDYKERTAAGALSAWQRHILPALGNIRVAELTVLDVNQLLEKLGSKPPAGKGQRVMANRVRAYLSAGLELAERESRKWRPMNSNPCRSSECVHFQERKRKVHIEPDQFAAMHRALQDQSAQFPWHVSAIYVILFSGARVTEIAGAKVSEYFNDGRSARIIKTEHKTDGYTDERTIRLPEQAARIIDSLPSHANGKLFGPLGDFKEPRRAIWDVWDAARQAAGLPDIQPRDLRRTFASVAKSQGVSLDQIGELFDHRSTATTARYAYLFDDQAKRLAQDTGDTIQKLLERPKE